MASAASVYKRLTVLRTGMANGYAWIVLFLALVLTVVAWLQTRAATHDTLRQRFYFSQAEIVRAVQSRLATYQQILRGGAGLLAASDRVDRAEWRAYVSSLDITASFPGILGVGYVPLVAPDGIARLEAEVRAEGFGDFAVWPPPKDEEHRRAGRSSILFLEPFDDRNRRAFGFDMLSEPVRRHAMLMARDSGRLAVSGRVRLVQEDGHDEQAGFLMYLPFYGAAGPPATLDQRRADVRGFVYAPFRAHDFMTGIEAERIRNLRVRLYSGPVTTPDHLIYDSAPHIPWPDQPFLGLETTTMLDVPGNVWTARFAALPSLESDTGYPGPNLLLAVGSGFSLLAFAAVRAGTGLRRAEDQNARLGRLVEEAATEIYVLNARDLRIVQANRGARENQRRGLDVLVGMSLLDLQPGIDLRRFVELTRDLRRGRAGQVSYDTGFVRADGSLYEATVTLQLHPTSHPPVYHALVQDMTERRRSEAALALALRDARKLLEEKETLLREVHHRVKNNLQVIWSLIKMEALAVRDPAARARMETVARRIGVLGQIHQQLYGAENVARVDVGEHLRRLCAHLTDLHAHQSVSIEVAAQSVTCDLETAIPIGLMVNELVSNSLEHAFPDGRAGHVRVSARVEHGRIVLEVADDGVGTEPAPDLRAGLGLRLVEALAGQLRADVEVVREGGTRTRIRLPADESRRG